jgi:DNA-binding cell septation regulator SpoVG
MNITIEHHDKSFNVALSSAQGKEAFLVIKGARIVDGNKGRFISWPAKKMDSGKYWNHVWSSEGFSDAVLKAYDASQKKPATARRDESDDVPF